MNYFELYELPLMPRVNRELVMAKYRLLQRQLHPDRHAGKSALEKQELEEVSADVNKAYAVFIDENRTLEYFLKTKGWLLEEEKYVLPSDFLMEMMELNEMWEEKGVDEYAQAIHGYVSELNQQVNEIMDKGGEVTEKEGREILVPFNFKKKYLLRLLDRLKD